MSEPDNSIRAARKRLEAVREAVSDLDRRIVDLDRRESEATPAGRLSIAREARTLRDQRLVAGDILAEAQAQYTRERERLDAAVQTTTRDLGRISKQCCDAAGRFDRALVDAVRALADLETEAAPLAGMFVNLTDYLHPRNLNAAIDLAFESRLGRSVAHTTKQSLSSRITVMVSEARETATQLKKREAA